MKYDTKLDQELDRLVEKLVAKQAGSAEAAEEIGEVFRRRIEAEAFEEIFGWWARDMTLRDVRATPEQVEALYKARTRLLGDSVPLQSMILERYYRLKKVAKFMEPTGQKPFRFSEWFPQEEEPKDPPDDQFRFYTNGLPF